MFRTIASATVSVVCLILGGCAAQQTHIPVKPQSQPQALAALPAWPVVDVIQTAPLAAARTLQLPADIVRVTRAYTPIYIQQPNFSSAGSASAGAVAAAGIGIGLLAILVADGVQHHEANAFATTHAAPIWKALRGTDTRALLDSSLHEALAAQGHYAGISLRRPRQLTDDEARTPRLILRTRYGLSVDFSVLYARVDARIVRLGQSAPLYRNQLLFRSAR